VRTDPLRRDVSYLGDRGAPACVGWRPTTTPSRCVAACGGHTLGRVTTRPPQHRDDFRPTLEAIEIRLGGPVARQLAGQVEDLARAHELAHSITYSDADAKAPITWLELRVRATLSDAVIRQASTDLVERILNEWGEVDLE
jgi:hypothetical protein